MQPQQNSKEQKTEKMSTLPRKLMKQYQNQKRKMKQNSFE